MFILLSSALYEVKSPEALRGFHAVEMHVSGYDPQVFGESLFTGLKCFSTQVK